MIQVIKIIIKYTLQIKYTTMWFLPCLFCAELTFVAVLSVVKKVSSNSKIQKVMELLGIILLTCVGLFLVFKFDGLIWNIDIALIVLPFMYVGYLLKQKNVLNEIALKGHKYRFLYISFFCVFILFVCKCEKHMDLFYGNLGDHPVLTYMYASILSVLLMFIISQCSNNKSTVNNFLNYVGRNTIAYFALHQMVIKQILIRVFDLNNDFKLLIAAIVSIIICTYLNRFMEIVKYGGISGTKVLYNIRLMVTNIFDELF